MPVGPLHPVKMLRHNPIKKCSETHLIPCSGIETVSCCKIVPCDYCLTFAVEYEADRTGIASLDKATGIWSGTIAGATFAAWWERNAYGVCEFVVTLNDVEVYREPCGGAYGPSCRDASDSTAVTIGYDSGTLSWEKLLKRPLPHVVPEGECLTQFCGDCECTCECLCVTITDSYGTVVAIGEICDTSYPCDGPVWAGVVGDYDLSLALGRDSYGQCIITATVDGYEQSPVSAGGCESLSATIDLADGKTISVRCKKCDCNRAWPCCGRCLPLDCLTGLPTNCVNGLPLNLTIELSATPNTGVSNCFNGSGTLVFRSPVTGGLCCWDTTLTGTCIDCNGATFSWSLEVTVCCGDEGWEVTGIAGGPCGGPGVKTVTTAVCDPVLLEGCWDNPVSACFVGCLDDTTPTPSPEFYVCFLIYEGP